MSDALQTGIACFFGDQGKPIHYKKALEAFETASAQNEAYGHYALGYMYDHGYGTHPDRLKAAELYERAWNQAQIPMAATALAYLYLEGEQVELNAELGQQWFDKGFAGLETLEDDRFALYWLATSYLDGDFIDQDYERAMTLFKVAAELGSSEAMCTLGYMHQEAAEDKDDGKEAFEWYSKAAEKGNPSALCIVAQMHLTGLGCEKSAAKAIELYQTAFTQYESTSGLVGLGAMYLEGEGVEKDGAKAIELLTQAAELGDEEAMFTLAHLYQQEDEYQDMDKAVTWLEKAAEVGHTASMNTLGFLYSMGEGVPQDMQKAIAYHERAALRGDADAMCLLGQLYHQGAGDESQPDYGKAMEWYLKAASKGDAEAMRLIGSMYESGEGVTKDEEKAIEWFQRAQEADSEEEWGDCCDDSDCEGCEDDEDDENDEEIEELVEDVE